jgi:hypothetical protein
LLLIFELRGVFKPLLPLLQLARKRQADSFNNFQTAPKNAGRAARPIDFFHGLASFNPLN